MILVGDVEWDGKTFAQHNTDIENLKDQIVSKSGICIHSINGRLHQSIFGPLKSKINS